MPRTLLTETGVYLPHSLRMDAIFLVALSALIVAMVATGRVSWGMGLVWSLLFVAAPAWRQAREYRKYGARGRPMVSIEHGELVVERPFDTRPALRMPLADVQRIVVYGRQGRRTLRLVRTAGEPLDITPLWGRRVEALALQFLQQALPQQVVIEEPQTVFADVRRDGPETS